MVKLDKKLQEHLLSVSKEPEKFEQVLVVTTDKDDSIRLSSTGANLPEMMELFSDVLASIMAEESPHEGIDAKELSAAFFEQMFMTFKAKSWDFLMHDMMEEMEELLDD